MSNISLDAYIARHESILRNLIEASNIPASRIKDAMLYSLFPGGKRIRPLLIYLCGQLLRVPLTHLDIMAAAIELIHCYSLIHDDLPAMDNDDYRRGKPSCHKAFDEATAILVGDGMQTLAVELLLSQLNSTLSPAKLTLVTLELVKASGPSGMISGQSLDLSELTESTINESCLREIHLLKTGKLILACINMVLAASNASHEEAHALRQFATHLGLVFQMQDDYLDRYDVNNQLGKHRASDHANQKTTYATLYSEEALSALIQTHFHQLDAALSPFDHPETTELRSLIHILLNRTPPIPTPA
jgi:farnesyl diphosphate synthase